MKFNSIKNIAIVAATLLVSNIAVAQSPFKYETKNCKFTQICPADTNWVKTSKSGYTPKSEDAMLYQKAEKCSGWYIQPGIFAGYTNLSHDGAGSSSSVSARAELIGGYDFCFGHKDGDKPRNFAISLEAKIQLTNMPKLVYEDLTYVKSGYVPTVGANIVFQFAKHEKCQISAFLGAGYTRLTSYYPNAGAKALDKLVHNTVNYEGGVQALWRTGLGHSIGVKAGYEHVTTNMVGRGQIFVGVVYKFKGSHKSHKMTYREYYNATH